MNIAKIKDTGELIVANDTAQETKAIAIVHDNSEYSMLFDSARFAQAWRVAKLFSESKLVPAHFQGSPQSVFIVLHLATRMNLDPFTAMQKIYVIQGKPGIEAQLVIALVNSRGPFDGPIQYREDGEGDNRKWTAFATHAKTGETCEATVTWDMVKKEGWAGKSGSKWMTMPSMMGRYRAATFLARLYCPEVIMGLSTVDELKDMDAEIVDVTPEPETFKVPQTEKIKEKLKRGRPAKTQETPQEAITPEAAVSPSPDEISPPAPPQNIPQGITEEQLAWLSDVPEDLRRDACEAFGADYAMPLNELDDKTADEMIAWLRAK
jgi:hypothetical protein